MTTTELFDKLEEVAARYAEYFEAIGLLEHYEEIMNPKPQIIYSDNTAPLPGECLRNQRRYLYPTHPYDCPHDCCNAPCNCPQCK